MERHLLPRAVSSLLQEAVLAAAHIAPTRVRVGRAGGTGRAAWTDRRGDALRVGRVRHRIRDLVERRGKVRAATRADRAAKESSEALQCAREGPSLQGQGERPE